jgi:hypothetical protein
MKRGPLRKEIAQDEKRAEYESQAVKKMSCCSGGPDFVRVDTSNENLTIGEFKPVEIGLNVRSAGPRLGLRAVVAWRRGQ